MQNKRIKNMYTNPMYCNLPNENTIKDDKNCLHPVHFFTFNFKAQLFDHAKKTKICHLQILWIMYFITLILLLLSTLFILHMSWVMP